LRHPVVRPPATGLSPGRPRSEQSPLHHRAHQNAHRRPDPGLCPSPLPQAIHRPLTLPRPYHRDEAKHRGNRMNPAAPAHTRGRSSPKDLDTYSASVCQVSAGESC
jgi:hypothetical protein